MNERWTNQGLWVANVKWMLWLLFVFLLGCAERTTLAPVTESAGKDRAYYVAQKGDTLFSIAWRYDKDFREIAYYNRLNDDAPLKQGQKIYLVPRKRREPTPPIVTKVVNYGKAGHWRWPTTGKVVRRFAPKNGQKGIEIEARYGQAVYASRGGRVAYSGDGLRGYGNLIIIKHGGDYLSAYAYNRANRVKEGQWVKAGAKIAEIGKKGKRRGVLHFEVRYRGKPVDPLKLLKRH